MSSLPIYPLLISASRLWRRCLVSLTTALIFLPLSYAVAITAGTRYPTNEEQYTLQLINRARASADGLTILQGFVTNNLGTITASTTGTSRNGTAWSSGFWKSTVPGVAESMNFFKVHPGDLKRQFMNLVIPRYPLAWQANLGNVAAGYNDLVIANRGTGPGFPHSLSPYQNQSTFTAYAKRYTDGGYGPLSDINALGENIAPNFFSSALATFAGFMVDWGYSANGIQSQDPNYGSHRLSLMGTDFVEIGVSRKVGWDSTAVTEVQEFGRRFSPAPALVGAVYTDTDKNGFYSPGEGLGKVTVTAAPAGGGTSVKTTTFSSGGYVLPIATPGVYSVAFTGSAGVLKTGSVTIGEENVALDAVVTPVVTPPNRASSDIDGDGQQDYVFFHKSTLKSLIWYMDGPTKISQVAGPTAPLGWAFAGVADFNRDQHPDLLLINASGRTAIWHLDGPTKIGVVNGPTLPVGWTVASLADFNRDGKVDYLLYQSSTGKTAVWYLDGAVKLTSPAPANGPTLPLGTAIVGTGDFNADGKPDLMLYFAGTRQNRVYYLNNAAKAGEAASVTLSSGWATAGVGDLNADGRPDLLTYAASTGRSLLRYLNGVSQTSAVTGPDLPAGWALIAP